MMDLRAAARALGGEVSGRGILCPGPGHSSRDRSLSVMPSPAAPGGFVVWSHAGDDPLTAKDYVRQRLGLPTQFRTGSAEIPAGRGVLRSEHTRGVLKSEEPPSDRTALALRIWGEARPPGGSPVEAYFGRRGLALPDQADGVLRYHPSCPFAGDRTPAMVALVRDVVTNAPIAIHRTVLDATGRKVEVNGKDRLVLGPTRTGAVKLTADAEVATCLGVGEGIESTLSLQRLPEFGRSPVWALLNAGGITALPVLPGIECLWVAVDNDPAGLGAADLVSDRWRRAGRDVFLVKARDAGADLNDLPEVRHG